MKPPGELKVAITGIDGATMTDDEFMQIEAAFRSALENMVSACEEYGVSADDRIADALHDAGVVIPGSGD
jgi:hypothetical protein